MKVMTDVEFASEVRRVLKELEETPGEVVITHDDRPIARLLPGIPVMTAKEAFGGLAGLLTDEEGEAWLRDMEGFDHPLSEELRNPWEE
ncbi:MAG: hypothetical protein FJ290_22280 [Planctomycetes bacterium]|nr:hypothetical protein [Planctomycetota bacterium]